MINKVIFYDGDMSEVPISNACFCVYARDGYSHNQKYLKTINKVVQNATVLTNDLLVWGNDIAWWNDKENKCQAYILKNINGKWKEINIQDLTEKEIRQAHDIVRMYMAGAFYKEV